MGRKAMTKERLYSHVEVDARGCWNWTGAVHYKTGYGVTSLRGKIMLAHRLSYLFHKVEIPEGLVIDHLCCNRRCINPDHLEAVTSRENNARSNSPSAANARKTHCKHGHPLDGENLVIVHRPGRVSRECRSCRRAIAMQCYRKTKVNRG